MIFAIVVAVILIPILLGLFFAYWSSRFDKAVVEAKEDAGNRGRGMNPALTLGHKIETTANPLEQVKQARLLAAKKAAALPRGANVRNLRAGESGMKTAWQGVGDDSFTAAKIAQHHGWQAVKSGIVEGEPMEIATGSSVVIPNKPVELIPGKDYPFIEITDDMEPAEKRKARIANAKAKSAANKAAKQRASGAAPAATTAAAASPQPAAVPAAPVAAIDPPTLVEITDDMTPEDKRKARIANSKAKSAYNKALKAAGVDPKAASASQAAPTPPPAPAAAAPAPEVAANVPPKPELIPMTDDMSPEDKRKARIANSKAKSAYNKALKAAGIDPKSVSW